MCFYLGNRPPAKLFYPEEEVTDDAKEVKKKVWNARENRDSMWFYKNNWYLDGFLYKEVKMQMVSGNDVKPDLQEMQHFKTRDNDGGSGVEAFVVPSSVETENKSDKNIAATFREGDRVIIAEGELAGLAGVVIAVNEVTQEIRIKGLLDDFTEEVTILASELNKVCVLKYLNHA